MNTTTHNEKEMAEGSSVFEYAGFWRRAGAHAIDQIVMLFILMFINGAIVVSFIVNMIMSGGPQGTHYNGPAVFEHIVRGAIASFIFGSVAVMVSWVYFAAFESSKFQATPGKLLIGIKVTGLDGNKITFARAAGRYFGKILSAVILYIGYLMVIFTKQKQGLHDKMAKTLVIAK